MNRGLTILGVLQAMLIVAGVLTVRLVLFAKGYPDAPALRWNSLAVLIREHGYWLMLLPLLWAGSAAILSTRDNGPRPWLSMASGYALLALLLIIFASATVFPATRSTLIAPH